MCLLTLIPDYVSPDMDRFKVAAQANPDGFGFAISTGKSIVTCHSMNFDEVANKFTDLRTANHGPAIFHFRWATHGTETVDNCHPFMLGQDSSTVLGHNGILPVDIKPGDTRSDTKVFAQDIFPNLGGITALDDNDYFVRLAAWAKGSKLAFLTVNDDATPNDEDVADHISLEGNNLTFFIMADMGQPVKVEFDLQFEEKTYKGSVNVGEFGSFPIKGDFESDPK